MNKLIIIGAGGHAISCIDLIESLNYYKIIGYVDNKKNNQLLKYKYLGTDNALSQLRKKSRHACIGIGQIKYSKTREKIFKKLKNNDFILPIIISKRSYVSKYSKLEEGTMIFNDVLINTNTFIGKNCIINNKANIEHGVHIGNNTHISTGVLINGDVKIGNNVFIGSGCIIHNSCEIGDNSIIGAGVVIKKNIPNNQIIK